MLSFLILSANNDGYGLADKLAKEGHLAKFYTTGKATIEGENPKQVFDYKSHIEGADVIIVCTGEGGKFPEVTLPGRRNVLGNGSFPKMLNRDMIAKILKLAEAPGEGEGFKVKVTGLFCEDKWRSSFLVSFPYDRLFEDDKGPICYMGESGVFTSSGLLIDLVKQLEGILKSAKYNGAIGVRFIVGKDFAKPYALSLAFTPFIYMVSEGLKGKLGKALFSTFLEEKEPVVFDSPITCLRLSTPPYPYDLALPPSGIKEVLLNPVSREERHFWTEGLSSNNITGHITAWGSDFNESRRRVYRTVKNLVRSSFVQFRKDIGLNDCSEKLEKLITWRWIDYATQQVNGSGVNGKGVAGQVQEDRVDREE